MPPLRRQHHLRSALEAFLKQRDLEAAYRALTLGGWMAHYFQSRGPRQEAALKTHVRAPLPSPTLSPHVLPVTSACPGSFAVAGRPLEPQSLCKAHPPHQPP